MRFIILKTECNSDGIISFFGANQSVRRASGNSINWIDLREAKTNTIEPDLCDLLSFDDAESAVDFLDDTEMSGVENVCIVGVESE
ncbi:MAG: hypothetical protein JGK24_17160 [Microcoleus sp. PH2017_29_MFU_D_A]|uniref:hypothetical protein n=1 Tax=unclassified Microcoleus TaxID=2642155 RepID=UPI001DC09D14|nr:MULTISPECIES: hypothetical protein [unclassified Microcoleus]MCC3417261.1 hypothetical protein [Microcoleus sp. PH2017_07_MST_O_A]MCC3464521.1 hypothetical protein [Microcoleus sp. PH2017_06_SFM_O_A]MCC3513620.1 hypothetical protein [Microcoleus sp. PH2017_17_BER_D_A]TAE15469.1 MAG: hypothetical protein EAZ94_04225 [Oscillatoriales cyanobacterium]MCC3439366.1 hypothetical protein [Microcoleus sp. PH2017_05_CCC_O_A]